MANKKTKKAQQDDPSSANQPAGLTINELRGRIAAKAYELYERRGGAPGQEVEDWLEAERMVMAEINSPGTKKAGPRRRRSARSNSG